MQFPYIFKLLLTEKGETQSSVANYLGTTQATISRWVCGQNEPDLTILTKLADFFDVSTDYLLGREDDFGNVATSSVTLTAQEQRILTVYRALSERDKRTVESLFETLSPTGINDVRV
ncbi:MAG: helix-turn-helix transcriptional regulator [Clostridia bacterium]|nr:helix-turn-helix transcriptional regulator [Clostridia bacterium]